MGRLLTDHQLTWPVFKKRRGKKTSNTPPPNMINIIVMTVLVLIAIQQNRNSGVFPTDWPWYLEQGRRSAVGVCLGSL